MKRCPECNRTFSDETLSFCLVDGAILSAPYDPHATLIIPQARQTEPPPTEVLKLEETKQEIPPTVASPQPERKPEELASTITAPAPAFESPEIKDTPAQPARKSKQLLWVTVSIIALVLIGIVAARKLSPEAKEIPVRAVATRQEPTYSVDKQRFDSALELFRREQFRAAREEWKLADPELRDARTQFYIAYAFYREGWGRVYADTDLMKKSLESINRAIEAAPNDAIVVDDPDLKIHTLAELKAEVEQDLDRNSASDTNPLKVFRLRK
jgi:hypothetical protein